MTSVSIFTSVATKRITGTALGGMNYVISINRNIYKPSIHGISMKPEEEQMLKDQYKADRDYDIMKEAQMLEESGFE